jgi:hypothetical protein
MYFTRVHALNGTRPHCRRAINEKRGPDFSVARVVRLAAMK